MELYSKDVIKEKLSTDRRWIERAIAVVFANQTCGEQEAGATVCKNGIGFTGPDAELLTSFAKWLARGMHLTVKQLEIARHKMPKYHKQISEAIKAKTA
jgi:hypothetical protein